MNTPPKVLVIIVTWNKKDYVLDLLDSLFCLEYPRQALDILVVDNASTDGTVEALQARQDITLLRNQENLGGTGGFNTGLAWAFEQPGDRYDFLWLLDNDVQVHRNALTALEEVLTGNPEIAVAGSTMMQLDYPWRINEMGAFFDRRRGLLKLNRHMEEIVSWKPVPLGTLRTMDIDLSRELKHCPRWMKVDYVAAASLLIRTAVAREAGLWDDFFIHFDDVDWCLRIAQMGHGIAVTTASIIWHLSAISKVPSWVLYYDNRNVLYLLEKHGTPGSVSRTRRWIRLKALYYAVLGKRDISRLHCQALQDYRRQVKGKRPIELENCYRPIGELETLLLSQDANKILLPWTLEIETVNLPGIIARVQAQRPELEVEILIPPHEQTNDWAKRLPGATTRTLPKSKLMRWLHYLRWKPPYDLVLQSDYQPIPALSRLGRKILFVNNEYLSLRDKPRLGDITRILWEILKS